MTRFLSIACALLLLTAGGMFLWARKLQTNLAECRKPHSPVEVMAGPADPLSVPVVDTYVDANGATHAIADATLTSEITRRAVRRAAPIAAKMDSIAAAVGVKTSQLEAYTAVQMAVVRDSVRFLARNIDSLRRVTRTFKDRYLTLLVREPVPDADSSDAGSFDFSYDADLKFIDYTRQRRFLGIPIGRRHYFTDISSSDPRLKIKGVERLTLARRVPALGFRLQALAGYNFDTRANTLGLGVRFDLGDRFNTGLNYTYSFLLRDWVPTIYAKYDLLQFGR